MTDLQKMRDLQDRLGLTIAARLSDGALNLPHDISERLKVARMQALAKRKVVQLQTAPAASVYGYGAVAGLSFGGDDRTLWNRVASLLPLLALIVGLLSIAVAVEDTWINEVAEVDAELLTDELPPDAYTDPGFAQYLRVNQRD